MIEAAREDWRTRQHADRLIQGDNGGSAEGTLKGTAKKSRLLAMGQWNLSTTFSPSKTNSAVRSPEPLPGPVDVGDYHADAIDEAILAISRHAQWDGKCWPKLIKDVGTIRDQFHHVIDIAPTILEAVGLTRPVDNALPSFRWTA